LPIVKTLSVLGVLTGKNHAPHRRRAAAPEDTIFRGNLRLAVECGRGRGISMKG
jgi:hypothetical protein